MQSNPIVTIITPVYNGAAFLEELILSIRSQDYPNIEHIIIDDGSTDKGATVEILNKYPHLRWWSRKNQGQYSTMNEGVRAAKGEIICFICADDIMAEQAVKKVIEWFKINPLYDAVYGLTNYISVNGEPLLNKHFVRYFPIKYYPFFTQVQHCSLYISRKVMLANDLLFNPAIKFVGDYDWIIRIQKTDTKIGFLDDILSTIRIHDNQISLLNTKAIAKSHREVAHIHGYTRLQFLFYITINRVLNLSEQVISAYQNGKILGVLKFLQYWIKNKLIPFIFHKT
jgi:glycosyltransferase involved in cell wall biosynthesis